MCNIDLWNAQLWILLFCYWVSVKCHNWYAALSLCLLSMCASNCVRDYKCRLRSLYVWICACWFWHSVYIVHDSVHFWYDFDIWYEGHFWCVLHSFWCCFHFSFTFCYVFCLNWLSCTLFPVAVLDTRYCHVPVPPFCSLDWRTCLWLVSLFFGGFVVFWEFDCLWKSRVFIIETKSVLFVEARARPGRVNCSDI